MDNQKKKVLNNYHVIFLVQSTMVGTGILVLPQKLSSVGYSQAIFPLFFGLIASMTLWLIVWLSKKFPNENLFRINEILLGKWLGKTINLLMVLQLLVFVSGLVSNYMHLIQSTVLTEQTITIPTIFLLLLLIYIISGEIKNIARFSIMTFFITIGVFYFTRWAMEDGEISHIFPLFNFSSNEFYEAMKKGYLSILGYELIMFYFPYIIKQEKALKNALIGIWISISLYLLTVVVSVMYFSEWQLEHIEFSVLNLFKAGEFSFIERIDIIGMTIWVFLVLSTTGLYLWSAQKGVETLLSKQKKYYLYILTIIIFIVVKLPLSQEHQEKLFIGSSYLAYILVIWPMFLSLVYLVRKKQVQP